MSRVLSRRDFLKDSAAVLAVAVLPSALTGCGNGGTGQQTQSQEAEEDVVTLTVFDKNANGYSFDDRIAQEIMERTGVKIELFDLGDDVTESEALMYAYQDYPDLIKIDLSEISKYQESGYLVDLQPYLSDAMPNVEEMYGETLDRLRTEQGELYYLSNWYGEDLDSVSGFQIRYDYLVKLVGQESADSDEPFTQEEFLGLLRAFAEQYPEVDGEASIPFSVCTSYEYMSTTTGMYGLKLYAEADDGQLYHLVRDSRYLQMFSFLNQMYREELMDKEWMWNRESLFLEKLKSGRVFATACAYWNLTGVNTWLRQEYGEDAFYACYKILGEGIEASETTYSGRNSLGWDAIAVTDHCENPEAAMKVLDFLASEEGQYLMLWGIEGEDWEYVDGVHTPTEETMELLLEDMETVKEETGIRRWVWCIKNGYGSDGTPYDLLTKYQSSTEAQLANMRMVGDYWDTSVYQDLDPESGTEESLALIRIEEIFEDTFPKLIDADSEDTMRELYDAMIEDMEAEGLSAVEAVWTENYQERLRQWE